MTEAIALLFSYSAQNKTIPPSPEEFFAYVRNLSTQTYQVLVPGPRRRISSRLIGASSPFTHFDFLNSIEPLNGLRTLVSSLVQAHAIGMRALTIYCALVAEEGADSLLRTHIAEPFVWYSNLLYHDMLNFRENGLGLTLSYINDGVSFLSSNKIKMRIFTLFEMYDKYESRNADSLVLLEKFLANALS